MFDTRFGSIERFDSVLYAEKWPNALISSKGSETKTEKLLNDHNYAAFPL